LPDARGRESAGCLSGSSGEPAVRRASVRSLSGAFFDSEERPSVGVVDDSNRELIINMQTTIEVLEADNAALRAENNRLSDRLRTVEDFYCPGEVVRRVEPSFTMLQQKNKFDALPLDKASLSFDSTESFEVESRGRRRRSKRRVLVVSDSHGREMGPLISAALGRSHESTVISRPGAGFNAVTSDVEQLADNFNFNDHVVVIGGTNDVVEHGSQTYRIDIKPILTLAERTNVIVAGIPFRYDKPLMNGNVFSLNQWLVEKLKGKNNINMLNMTNFDMEDYTKHGLHLNRRTGKAKLRDMLLQSLVGVANSNKNTNDCSNSSDGNSKHNKTYTSKAYLFLKDMKRSSVDGTGVLSLDGREDSDMSLQADNLDDVGHGNAAPSGGFFTKDGTQFSTVNSYSEDGITTALDLSYITPDRKVTESSVNDSVFL
jgi:hypothetical protein